VKKLIFICFSLFIFDVFRLFWYVHAKNELKKYYFNIFLNKNYFKK